MMSRRIPLLSLIAATLAVALALGLPRWGSPGDAAAPSASTVDAAASRATADPRAAGTASEPTADPTTRLAQATAPDAPGAERLRAHARAAKAGDAETLAALMTGGDYAAFRAARDLAAMQEVDAATRLAALERVLALRIDEPLARGEERTLQLALASVAEAAGKGDRALLAYREALPAGAAVAAVERLVPDPYARSNVYLQAGMDQKALDALGELSAPSIEAPALRDLGRHQEALAKYRQWLEEVPGSLDARYGLAWSHWYLGDLDAADAAFAELPGTSALYGRALVANRRGDVDRAVELLRRTGEPNRLWLATALLEREGRNQDAAEVYLELAAATGSILADDAAWRARVLGERLGDAELVAAAEAALPADSFFGLRLGHDPRLPTRNDLDPVHPDALDTAAWLMEFGDVEGARGVLAFALRAAEDEAEAVALGEALTALQEYRIPQRAATALLREGSEQLRTWRLAYPRAWPTAVATAAEAAGVDPELVWAVMRQESAFYPTAVSRSGAQGLMQVMPSTWDWLAELQKEAPADPYDPVANVRYGTFYLGWLANYFDGDLELVVPSYNRGQGYIRRLFEAEEVAGDKDELFFAIDALETREYLQAVWLNYETYRALDRLEAELADASAGVRVPDEEP